MVVWNVRAVSCGVEPATRAFQPHLAHCFDSMAHLPNGSGSPRTKLNFRQLKKKM